MAITDRLRGLNSVWYNLAAFLVILAWGCSFVSTKVMMESGYGPTQVFLLRAALAYLMLLAVNHSRIRSNSLYDEMLFLACGLSAGSLYFIAENTALDYTRVSNVSLIASLSPLFTALLLGAIYRSERPTRGVLLGSIMAIIGVGCVIFQEGFSFDIRPKGDMLALLAALLWAVYSIVLKKLTAFYSALFITRKTFFYGFVTGLPFLLAEKTPFDFTLIAEPAVWTNLVFLGVVCSMGAFLLWARVNKWLGAVKANNYLYFQPVVTMIASAIILGERVTAMGLLGCALILAGVMLADRLGRH